MDGESVTWVAIWGKEVWCLFLYLWSKVKKTNKWAKISPTSTTNSIIISKKMKYTNKLEILAMFYMLFYRAPASIEFLKKSEVFWTP